MRQGLARILTTAQWRDRPDWNNRGGVLREQKFGNVKDMISIVPFQGPYAQMIAASNADLLAIKGARWRVTDQGLTFVEWVSDGTAWRQATAIICTGTPLGAVIAPVGSWALRTDGGASTTFYVKESATDATGWVAK